jgi:hypothetical protein
MLPIMSGAEERMASQGLILQETELGRDDDPAVGGCLMAEISGGMAGVQVVIRPGLAGQTRADFAEWAESRINRFLEHGPEPDGWRQRPDGVWQLWGRLQEMPSLDWRP